MKIKKSKLNLTLPLATTFVLMVLVVVYTSALFYRISVSNIYDVGEDKISGVTANLGNYIDTTKSVLWVTADTVDVMVQSKVPSSALQDYLVLETQKHKSQFDENYTGLYGYIGGEYVDGLEWVPPDDYDPKERDWYKLASQAGGQLVIVPPYIDAQTGSTVISVCKCLSNSADVVSLDVYTTHIQEIIESTNINGKGYGFIVDKSGTVIAHPDKSLNGTNFNDVYGGADLMTNLSLSEKDRFEAKLNGKNTTVFTEEIMDQWYLVIAVDTDDLFKDVYRQLAVNISINTIVFVLIALFYFISYRNQQKSSREAEAFKISEQQQAYEAQILRLEKAAADSSNKAKGDFLAQMSHEIRTPINAVLGMNEMILRETTDENILEYSENIQTAGRTLLALVNSILDFSKIEDGKMEIIPVKYDTVSLINNLVNSVAERAKSKGLELKVIADPQLPCELVGDDVRVTQVIGNLLTNAVKYTEKGSVTFEIRCKEFNCDETTLWVSIRDTGIGIREEDLERMFESFTRLDTVRNRNIEGTGLGMAIVTKLLDLMGSKLSLKSVYGQGSEFYFELKQSVADPMPIGNALEKKLSRIGVNKKQYKHYTGASVLVTDDNDMNLKVVQNLLKLFDIKPDLAHSGEETIELMNKKHYDLLLLDHMMPKMDGIETFEALRDKGLLAGGTVVIALTANAVLGAKEMYLSKGFNNYLSKPIEVGELDDMLSNYLHLPSESAPVQAEETAVVPETPEFITKLSAQGLDTDTGMMYCMYDAGFYKEMLSDFAASYDKHMGELNAALESGDMKLYRTNVHSLKSSAKAVGVMDISALALSLEEAADKGDKDFVTQHHDELEELFGKWAERIKSALG